MPSKSLVTSPDKDVSPSRRSPSSKGDIVVLVKTQRLANGGNSEVEELHGGESYNERGIDVGKSPLISSKNTGNQSKRGKSAVVSIKEENDKSSNNKLGKSGNNTNSKGGPGSSDSINQTGLKSNNWIIDANNSNNNLTNGNKTPDSLVSNLTNGSKTPDSLVSAEISDENDTVSPIHTYEKKRQFSRSTKHSKSFGPGQILTPKQPPQQQQFSRSSSSKSLGTGLVMSTTPEKRPVTPSFSSKSGVITPGFKSASVTDLNGSVNGSLGNDSRGGSFHGNLVSFLRDSTRNYDRPPPDFIVSQATGSGRVTPVQAGPPAGRESPTAWMTEESQVSMQPMSHNSHKYNVANGRLPNSGYAVSSPIAEQVESPRITISIHEKKDQLSVHIPESRNGLLVKSSSTRKSGKSVNGMSPLANEPPSPANSTDKIWDEESDEEAAVPCCGPEKKVWRVVVKLLCCVLAGIVFGWCMEKSRVFEPASIRLQMVFRRWIMLKMFLAAVAAGQFVMSVISLLPWTKARFSDSVAAFAGCFAEKKGIITSIIGPFVLGCGMTLSGACPGMVLIQVGSWAKNAIFTLLGVLLGSLVYGLFAHWIVKLTKPRKPFKKHTIFETLKIPYAALAAPMAVLITVTVFLMEWFINWEDDLEDYNINGYDLDTRNMTDSQNYNIFTMKSWPPSIAGALIGVLQVITIFSVTDTLGGSSGYVTVVSQWVIGKKLQKWFPYLASARTGIANWWQVFYVFGAVLGGLFSALGSQSIATTKGVSIVTAFCGGVLMLLGARFGAGCTSGHGLSGMGLLFWMSFLAVPAMFAGGIVTAFSMDATGALEDYKCHSQYDWMCDT